MDTKTCTKCGLNKSLDEFYKSKRYAKGVTSRCIKCIQKYNKSIPRLISNIYSNQKKSSKRRGHPMPEYSKEELTNWITSQPNFLNLYEQWVASGFKREMVPSVDRLKDELPYTLSNIRLTYWKENKLKYINGTLRAGNHPNKVSINQYSLKGKFIANFDSITEASKKTGILTSSIGMVCSKDTPDKTAKGFVFKYAADVDGKKDIPAVKRYRSKDIKPRIIK